MRNTIFVAVILLAMATAAMAGYTGTLPVDNTPNYVQNTKGVKPVAGAAGCLTYTAKTKATLGPVSMTDSAGKPYLMLDWESVDAAGSLVTVHRFLNSNTASRNASSGQVICGRDSDVTAVTFTLYSSATPKTGSICYDRQ